MYGTFDDDSDHVTTLALRPIFLSWPQNSYELTGLFFLNYCPFWCG